MPFRLARAARIKKETLYVAHTMASYGLSWSEGVQALPIVSVLLYEEQNNVGQPSEEYRKALGRAL